jgi:hypothetical protein
MDDIIKTFSNYMNSIKQYGLDNPWFLVTLRLLPPLGLGMCFAGMILKSEFFTLYFILFLVNLLGTLGAGYDLYFYYTTYYKIDLENRQKEEIKNSRKVR